MTKVYRPNLDFPILGDSCAGDEIDAEALRGVHFEAPSPGPHDQIGTATILHYFGLTKPPVGPDGKPVESLPSLQVRVLTGELEPGDINIVRNVANISDEDLYGIACHALRSN